MHVFKLSLAPMLTSLRHIYYTAWLRHHAGTMKWMEFIELADTLIDKVVELNQLPMAEKAQLLSLSAQKFHGIATNFLQESRSTLNTTCIVL